jgi:hypothetical protein
VTPEQIEDEIDRLLLECGNTWFGGQREIIRAAMRKLAYRAEQPVVMGIDLAHGDDCATYCIVRRQSDGTLMVEACGEIKQSVGQTRRQSMIEALVGTGIGFIVALMSQVFIMYWYGLPSTFGQDVGITLFFTGISILRGYAVRRYFNWRWHRG